MSDLPFDEPTDAGTKRRGPGRPRKPSNPDAFSYGTHPKQPAPEGATRCLEDIPERFRHPTKPPTRAR